MLTLALNDSITVPAPAPSAAPLSIIAPSESLTYPGILTSPSAFTVKNMSDIVVVTAPCWPITNSVVSLVLLLLESKLTYMLW